MIFQPIIPTGRPLYGLTFLPTHLTSTGRFINPSAMKLVWHTTEGDNFGPVVDLLRSRRAEPHFVLNPYLRRVQQLVRLDQYARALEHPPGTPETNRAGCIQVEIVGRASEAFHWDESIISAIASLALLIEHRTGIKRIADHPFVNSGAARVEPDHWAMAHGHFGHEHAPSQPSGHWDPGALNIGRVFTHMRALDA